MIAAIFNGADGAVHPENTDPAMQMNIANIKGFKHLGCTK
jgi:hypothetical protein